MHDIHVGVDGEEADAEEEEEDQYRVTDDTFAEQDTERRNHEMEDNMSENDGDIEDADGMETERRIRPNILNRINGAVELSHLE